MFISRRPLAVAAAGAVLSIATAARAEAPDSRAMRIQDLESKITALEAQQSQDSRDLATTIDRLLRDAETRSQLLAAGDGTSAGYDNGFYIRGPEGWLLKPGAQFQFRNVTEYRQNTSGGKADEVDNGFEVRRMKLELAGTAFTKDLEYQFLWATNREGGSMYLEEAWVRYMFADLWGVRTGQMKDPVTHEFTMSTKRQLAVETSLADSILGGGVGGWTQGALLVYGNNSASSPLNVEAGLTDGANQSNTDFTGRPSPLSTDPTVTGAPAAHAVDFGLAGRAEWKLMGDWKNYRDFTAMGTTQDLLVLGGGTDWSQGGDGNLILGTLDAQYENAHGLGLYGAALLRHMDKELNTAGKEATDWGLLAQVSYMCTPAFEIFGRYDVTFFDNEIVFASGDSEDTFHELTIGLQLLPRPERRGRPSREDHHRSGLPAQRLAGGVQGIGNSG